MQMRWNENVSLSEFRKLQQILRFKVFSAFVSFTRYDAYSVSLSMIRKSPKTTKQRC